MLAAQRPRVEAGTIRRLVLLVCAIVLLAFVGLVPAGMWYDEFFTIAHIRDDGIAFELQRLLGWSPRPLSELFVYLYARAVIALDRPLIGTALAPAWALVALAIVLPALVARRGLLVCAVLGCLFLVGHAVAEVFYWPIGALAYLPTLAALALLVTLDMAGFADRPVGRAWTLAALLVAALSTEIGAVLCAAYCLLAGGSAAVTRDRTGVWLLLPLLVSVAVLYLVSQGRVGQSQEAFGDAAIAHHPWRAILASVRSFALQVVGTDSPTPLGRSLLVGSISKIAFFLGAYLTLSTRPIDGSARGQLRRCALVAALVGSAFVTLTAAYYQFGTECCQRHATMRQASVLLAVGTLALALAAWRPRPDPVRGGWLLLLALLMPLAVSGPRLAADYRHYRRFLNVRADTWRSGANTGPLLIVPQTRLGKIVGGTLVAPGVYTASGPNEDVYAQRVIGFFRKETGRFLPP